ncbi:MAG: hypothetical protein HY381_02770 [Candidatus Chisholmbacteria bacterium]|nr:hypothetical protein [Candidatus Chisholmbacteria bacterium]
MNWLKLHRRARKLLSLPRLLSLTLVSLIVFIIAGPALRLRRIFCQVDTNPCPTSVLSQLQQLQGRSVLFLNTANITKSLLDIPDYKAATATVNFPSTLRVTIAPRTPAAQVITASDSARLLVDDEGIILSPAATPANLPVIFASTLDSESLVYSIKLAQLLTTNFLSYQQITIVSPQTLEVVLSSGVRVRFTSLKDASSQLRSLQLILRQATIDPIPQLIDVRFDKPVISH